MHFLSIVILSSFTLPATQGVPNTTPPPCYYNYNCLTGSACSLLKPCGGQCYFPPAPTTATSCTVGATGICQTDSLCTPDPFCQGLPSCSGICIYTGAYKNVSTTSITCVEGGTYCPGTAFCSRTEICAGVCTPAATASPTPTTMPCGGKNHCPKGYKCEKEKGKDCGDDNSCYGVCVPK